VPKIVPWFRIIRQNPSCNEELPLNSGSHPINRRAI
jgi:hypothetical protein